MIKLEKTDYIASGLYCHCYQHPANEVQCIKVPSDHKKATKRLKADLSYYKKLHAKQTDMQYIADYFGTTNTSLGTGYIYQCIKDYDGTISKTLLSHLEENTKESKEIFPQLQALGDYLIENQILISDIHSKNILVQKLSHNETKLIIVDGIGDHVFIKIFNMFKSGRKKKITRRWNKYITQLPQQHLSGSPLSSKSMI